MKILSRLYLLALGIIVIACQTKTSVPSVDEIEQRALAYYKDKAAISYDLNYQERYFTNSDTTSELRSVKWVRNDNDSVVGAMLEITLLNPEYNYIFSYSDYKTIYFHINDSTYSVSEYQAEEDEFDYRSGTYLISLFKGDTLFNRYRNDSTASLSSYDTTINNQNYWVVETKSAGNYMFTDAVSKYYFGQDDYRLASVEKWSKMMSSFNYSLYDYKNQSFSLALDDMISDRKIKLSSFTQDTSKPKYTYEELEKNAPTSMPSLTMYASTDSSEVNLSEFKGQVVLLDFWYMACGWCFKGLPHLKELYEKYQDRVQIIGINPFDGADDYLNGFIKDAGMAWPTYLISRKQTRDYFNVSAFPTYIVYDQAGNVVYRQPGYSDRFVEIMDSVFTSLEL